MDDDLTQLDYSLGISVTDVEAIHMFELFSSFERAGFNERQALTLVAYLGIPDNEVAFLSTDDQDVDDDDE
jgi:hypothetical protein